MTRPPLEAILVVIPIHDEEALLSGCLNALSDAIAAVQSTVINPPTISVKLVLDSCTDASAAIASASEFTVIVADVNNVGEARACGVALGLHELVDSDPAAVWIANTDGDSSVPANWLCEQIEIARRGADVMIGTVRPDFADLSDAQRNAWTRTHVPGEANGHVHGANLGFRASRYLEAGGYPRLPEHEDVQLVAALRSLPGIIEEATDACCVLTSGRAVGRTPGGYARYLSDDLIASAG